MPGPLDDITILDLTEYIAGPYATKLLADYGANVIKLERPGGDPARRLGPFAKGKPHPERSGTFFYFNTNKRSVCIDLKSSEGREQFDQLLRQADVVVESFRPGTLERLGLGWEHIQSVRADLPLVSITPFGQESPYRDYKVTDLVLYGFAGEMYTMGVAEREPVKMYGTAALVQSGSAAANAVLAAAIVGREQGIGQHVDFAMADSHFGGADRRHVGVIAFEFSGRRTPRTPAGGRGILQGVYPCADGYVEFSGAGGRIDRLAAMLGNPEWLDDPKWRAPGAAMNPDLTEEFEGHFYPWLFEHTKREIWAKAREARVLCGPLLSTEELVNDPYFRERGFWVTADHPEMGTFEFPGAPFRMPECPWELRRPAPLLGQHTAEVLAETSAPRPALPATGRPAVSSPELPLGGLRVLDLCVVWAGPFSTLLLGDLGAEVIKIENPFVMQPMTRGTIARPPKELVTSWAPARGGYPNNDPGPRPWNYNPTFVSLYRNKKSFTVDLRRPEGRAILARLIAKTDVVVENNASETLPKLGITYEWLQSINPEILMLRVPAYGSEGEYAQARALGVHLESVMGHTLLRGYHDLDPSHSTAIFSGDYLAGAQAALAVMLAAWHRKKTGRGQKIELGQAENASGMLAQSFMSYLLTGDEHERIGNQSIYGDAPSGVYPCKSPGPASEAMDRWISIQVMTDREWLALREAMGDPEWAKNPALATREGRYDDRYHIDAQLAEWTKDQDDYELFHLLQRAGVPAAPVLEGSRAFDDPHVQARGLYKAQTLYDGIGPYRFTAPFYKFPATPITVRQPPVAMGEHNDYVYREVIGVSEEEYDALKAAGHVSMDFDPSIP